MIRTFALAAAALLLAGCHEAPDFVRFERGEEVTAKVSRSHGQPCAIAIFVGVRLYHAALEPRYCQEAKR